MTHMAYEITEKLYAVRARCQRQRQHIIAQLQTGDTEAVRQLVTTIYDKIETDLEQAIAMARAIEVQHIATQGHERGDSSHDMRCE